jgi:hypothetical protein
MYEMFKSADRSYRFRSFAAYLTVYAVVLSAMGMA